MKRLLRIVLPIILAIVLLWGYVSLRLYELVYFQGGWQLLWLSILTLGHNYLDLKIFGTKQGKR